MAKKLTQKQAERKATKDFNKYEKFLAELMEIQVSKSINPPKNYKFKVPKKQRDEWIAKRIEVLMNPPPPQEITHKGHVYVLKSSIKSSGHGGGPSYREIESPACPPEYTGMERPGY